MYRNYTDGKVNMQSQAANDTCWELLPILVFVWRIVICVPTKLPRWSAICKLQALIWLLLVDVVLADRSQSGPTRYGWMLDGHPCHSDIGVQFH